MFSHGLGGFVGVLTGFGWICWCSHRIWVDLMVFTQCLSGVVGVHGTSSALQLPGLLLSTPPNIPVGLRVSSLGFGVGGLGFRVYG